MELVMMWKPYPWVFGSIGCKIVVVLSEIAAYVSMLTMTAFTFARFTAICFPLRPSLHCDVKRTRFIIGGIWALALVPAAVWTRYIRIHHGHFGDEIMPESAVCGLIH